MNWKSGIWVESVHGAHRNYEIAYILAYKGWDTFAGDKFDAITLSIEGGVYKSGGMHYDKYMDEQWKEINMPPFAERHAMKVVFA